jgi:hypothetical protein
MREHEMRMRVERVLQVCARQALVPALGIGLTIGGCATGRSAVRSSPPKAHPENAAEPVGDPEGSHETPIYSALLPREGAEPHPPKPEPEQNQDFDPRLDLP